LLDCCYAFRVLTSMCCKLIVDLHKRNSSAVVVHHISAVVVAVRGILVAALSCNSSKSSAKHFFLKRTSYLPYYLLEPMCVQKTLLKISDTLSSMEVKLLHTLLSTVCNILYTRKSLLNLLQYTLHSQFRVLK
jgi:hypothetical protein